MSNDIERLAMSIPEAAKALGISRNHAYMLAAKGEIPPTDGQQANGQDTNAAESQVTGNTKARRRKAVANGANHGNRL